MKNKRIVLTNKSKDRSSKPLDENQILDAAEDFAQKLNYKPKTRFGKADRHKFISKEAVAFLDHPAKKKSIIGGKGTGKNRIVATEMIAAMEENYRAHNIGLRKYKTNSADILHRSIANMALEIKNDGYDIPTYEAGQSKTYRMVKKNKTENQEVLYGSFEGYDQIAGLEAPGLGYVENVLVDEPILQDERPDKIPSPESWKLINKSLKDTISRSAARFVSNFPGTKYKSTTYFYTMNPWGSHPHLDECERISPEADFREYVKKDLFNNHTTLVYSKEDDHLVMRATKFANPQINIMEKTMFELGINNKDEFKEKAHLIDFTADVFTHNKVNEELFLTHLENEENVTVYTKAIRALEFNDAAELARVLGFKYEQESKDAKTYSLENLKLADTDKIMKSADIVSRPFIAWDIDQKRGGRFVFTPVWLATKGNLIQKVTNIIVGKQVIINAPLGVGDNGEKIPYYFEQKAKIVEDFTNKFITSTNTTAMPIMYVDDNSKHYVKMFAEQIPYVPVASCKFKNKDGWRIVQRQNWLQLAIDSGLLIMDKDNHELLKSLKASYIREGADQRDESGGQAKLYDPINSMEYALYSVRGELTPFNTAGNIEDYYKEA